MERVKTDEAYMDRYFQNIQRGLDFILRATVIYGKVLVSPNISAKKMVQCPFYFLENLCLKL